MLKCHKIGPSYAITSSTRRNSRINVFKKEQPTNKVTLKIFRGLVVKEEVRLMFCRAKASMKGKCYVLSGYKQLTEPCI